MTAGIQAGEGIRVRMVRGAFWRGAGKLSSQLMGLVTLAVLARLVAPEGFGLLGMAAVLTELVARLGDLGLGAALIQREALDEEQISSVFWVLILLGLVSWLLLVAVDPLFAGLMHQQQLVGIVAVSGVAFLVTPFGSTHRNILTRDLRFGRLAAVDLAGALVYGLVAIWLALVGAEVWGLVYGGLARAVVTTLGLWVASSWRPHFRLRRRDLAGLMPFGLKAWAQVMLGYAHENGDYFVVGRMLGSTSLGFYTMAFTLANFPRSQLGGIISAVAFPGLSRIQHDRKRVGRGFHRMVRYVSLVSFPLLVGLVILAHEFILVVYGERWLASVLPLQLLAVAAVSGSVISMMPSILLAMDEAGLGLKLAIAENVVFFTSILIGVRWGISGVACALMLQATLFLFVFVHYVNRIVGARISGFFSALAPAFGASAAMGIVVAGARLGLLHLGFGPGSILAASVSLGALVYVGVLMGARIREFEEIRESMKKRFLARRSAGKQSEFQ